MAHDTSQPITIRPIVALYSLRDTGINKEKSKQSNQSHQKRHKRHNSEVIILTWSHDTSTKTSIESVVYTGTKQYLSTVGGTVFGENVKWLQTKEHAKASSNKQFVENSEMVNVISRKEKITTRKTKTEEEIRGVKNIGNSLQADESCEPTSPSSDKTIDIPKDFLSKQLMANASLDSQSQDEITPVGKDDLQKQWLRISSLLNISEGIILFKIQAVADVEISKKNKKENMT